MASLLNNFPTFDELQLNDAVDKLEGKHLIEPYMGRTSVSGVSERRILFRTVV